MEYQVLARRWRPQSFEDVVSQDHITKTLTNAIRSNHIAHAYIFSGMRGIGKTTMARIFAKALNCENGPTPSPCNTCNPCREITDGRSVDIIEIDGASNTGVDDVRELKEQVKYLPMRGGYKIFIIDEVHMLSNSAFNALLKTLEEPPAHVIFIFATTEVHKIPATIISRCQHFNFKRIPRHEIVKRLRSITREEGISITDRSIGIIARMAEGSMRDSLSILDQVVSYSGKDVKEEDLYLILGIVDRGIFTEITDAISKKDSKGVIILAKRLLDSGYDIRQFCGDLVEHFRNILVAKISERCEELIEASREEIEEIRGYADQFSLEELQRLVTLFSNTQDEIRMSSIPGITLEMALIKATHIRPLQPVENILERLSRIERYISSNKTMDSDRESSVVSSESCEPVSSRDQRERGGERDRSNKETDSIPVIEEDKGGEIDATRIRERWERVVKRIKDKKPHLGSYLEEGVLIGIDNNEIRLGYDSRSSFLIGLIQKEENRKYVLSILQKEFKERYRLTISTISESLCKERSLASERKRREEEEKENMFKDARSHPIIKEAINIFKGELVEVVPQTEASSQGGK